MSDLAINIKDLFPTLKISYQGRLVYMDTVWLGRLVGVDFSKAGRYLGCLYTLKKNLELMFIVERKGDELHIKELFGRFEPFSCTLDTFVSSIMKRRKE